MQTVTQIIVDLSGSMKGGKIAYARQLLLEEILPVLNYSARIGLKTFRSINNIPQIKEITPLNVTDLNALKAALEKMGTPDGGTPIAASIRDAVQTLKRYPAYEKRIILLTDGEETDGGDYELEARKAGRDGFYCQIHIIGLDLSIAAIAKAKRIAEASNGSFSHIQVTANTTYDASQVRSNLRTFHRALRKTNTPVSTPTTTTSAATVKIKTPNAASAQPMSSLSAASQTQAATLDRPGLTLSVGKRLSLPSRDRIRECLESVDAKLRKAYGDRVHSLSEPAYRSVLSVVYEETGEVEYYVMVKPCLGDLDAFALSKEEWRLFLNHTKNTQLYLVRPEGSDPAYFFTGNLLDALLRGKIVPYLPEAYKIPGDTVCFSVVG